MQDVRTCIGHGEESTSGLRFHLSHPGHISHYYSRLRSDDGDDTRTSKQGVFSGRAEQTRIWVQN